MKLIKTLPEIQNYVPVSMTTSVDVIAPFISAAERNYLVPLVGRDQFAELVAAYEEANQDVEAVNPSEMREAIIACQRIVSNLGYFKGIPVLAVMVGNSGIQVASNENTKQAFQWQVEDLKESLLELGFSAIEDLLLLMEESPDVFPEYIESEQYRRQEGYLIENAREFSNCYNINDSRYTFQTIAYIMKRIEEQTVNKLFGSAFFNSLKEDTVTGKAKDLCNDFLKPGIALLTIEKAIRERIVSIDGGRVAINIRGDYGNMKENLPAERDQVESQAAQLNQDGNEFLKSGLDFISQNLSDFPEFVPVVANRRYRFKNDKTKGIFGI